ncbi:MAG: hypothetical protein QOH05_1653, partial [Acetobacteraceae bacterium]|nr:hypothetical protein [Acetobacteraceae bacterium]
DGTVGIRRAPWWLAPSGRLVEPGHEPRPRDRAGTDRRARNVRPVVPGRWQCCAADGQASAVRGQQSVGPARRVRAADAADRGIAAHQFDRAARDGHDHLRRAVFPGTPLRLAGSCEQRPGVLEHRYDVLPGGFAELQPHRTCGEGCSLRSGAGIRHSHQGSLGQLGRGCVRAGQGDRPVPGPGTRSRAQSCRQALPGQGTAERCSDAAGLSGAVHGGSVGGWARTGGAACRLRVRGHQYQSRRTGILCRCEGAARSLRTITRSVADIAGRRGLCWTHGAGGGRTVRGTAVADRCFAGRAVSFETG